MDDPTRPGLHLALPRITDVKLQKKYEAGLMLEVAKIIRAHKFYTIERVTREIVRPI